MHKTKPTVTRRALLESTAFAATALATAPWATGCAAEGNSAAPSAGGAALSGEDGPAKDPTAPLQIAMVLFPNFTLLDLVGPQGTLGRLAQTYLVAGSLEPVPSDSGVPLTPTTTYAECPNDLDVLFVPGGAVADAMRDPELLAFLRDRAHSARYVTSVCTGALVLAAAGLLNGYRAATHWGARDILALFDVEVVNERVVFDRNRVSGGGVTAGIDFGLALAAELRGEQQAQVLQLMNEYNPAPPFNAGSPESAGPELVSMARMAVAEGTRDMLEAAHEATKRMQ